jgi:phosphate transport system substrate-binding protein
MPESESPLYLSKKPVLTLRISERTAIAGLISLTAITALVVVGIEITERRHSVEGPPAGQESQQRKASPSEPNAMRLPTAMERSARLTPAVESPRPNGSEKTEYSYAAEKPVSMALPEAGADRVLGQPPQGPFLQAAFAPAVTGSLRSDRFRTDPATLEGAGATFPFEIYQRWFDEFHRRDPEVAFQYQSIGSGGGIRRVIEGAADFGASDVPMSDAQLAETATKIIHIPTVLGAVVPVYNIPGVRGVVRFTPEALTGIYLGKITSWSDPEIAIANRRLNLPDLPIVVVHRSDGSSTTFMFTDYLSKVSGTWQTVAGRGTSVKWPVGIGGKGDEGVASIVGQKEGAIGYVDFRYAEQNRLSFGSVLNPAGQFVTASIESMTAAAGAFHNLPADFRVSITAGPGWDAYPISSFTWLLVPEQFPDPARRKDLLAFLNWMIEDGQAMSEGLGYAPLPNRVALKVKQKIVALR